MKLTWLGHACFVLEHEGYRIVADPYLRVEDYPHMHTQAHAYTCSHQHLDHNGPERVELLEQRESPFTIETVSTFHDPEGGTLRGTNTVHIYSAGGIRVAHMGDLGHRLTTEQVEGIGRLDAVMIPVGGFYTIDAAQAMELVTAVNPRIVVPMHYRSDTFGYEVLATVEDYLALCHDAVSYDTNVLEITADTPAQTAVLRCPN